MCGQLSSEKKVLSKTAELVWDRQAWHLLRANEFFDILANIKKVARATSNTRKHEEHP